MAMFQENDPFTVAFMTLLQLDLSCYYSIIYSVFHLEFIMFLQYTLPMSLHLDLMYTLVLLKLDLYCYINIAE